MKIRVAILAAVFALSGCASLKNFTEEAGEPETYAKCAALDVASTALFLSTTRMHEMNPLVNALHIKALGHVIGTAVPLIGLSYLWYRLLREVNEPVLTAASSAITCGLGVRNLWLIAR